ncbi:MAG TPA: hypothetical protein PK228_05545 [Saprospiraceae bacterium]|nr:hypothetical protein [Saprospiraceae bacterium]
MKLSVMDDNLGFWVRRLFACRVFIACHPADVTFREDLRHHLFSLSMKHKLKIRDEKDAPFGVDKELKIKEFVSDSDVLLMLLSVDFQSDETLFNLYWTNKKKDAIVIPIQIKDCIPRPEIKGLNMTPTVPINKAPDKDEAFTKVVLALEKVFENHFRS